MAELFLVRHGQASFGGENYDQLSPLGERQAFWLGEYFSERGLEFDRVFAGTMQRHRQTAEALFDGAGWTLPIEEDQGLDEYDFLALYGALGDEHPELKAMARGDKRTFYKGLKQVLQLWSEDKLGERAPETWGQFVGRVGRARQRIAQCGGQRVLVLSSGGPISVIAQQALQAPNCSAIALNMQLRNCSFCQVFFNRESFHLASFNSIPHLDQLSRLDSITYG